MKSFENIILRSILALALPTLLFSQRTLAADLLKVDLQKELAKVSAKNLYDLEPKSKPTDLSALSRMKYFEIKKNWAECADLGSKVLRANRDLEGWIATSWLKCELKKSDSGKGANNLTKPVEWLSKHPGLLAEGPWKSSLSQDYIQAVVSLVENDHGSSRVMDLLNANLPLSKDVRAQLLSYAAETAEKKKDFEKALYFYDLSLQQRDNRSVRERFEAMKTVSKTPFNSKPAEIDGVLANEGAEVALEEKMNKAQKNGDLLSALKTSVVIETEYAGSKLARKLKDRPFEIYQQIFEGSPNDEKDEKGFAELEKVDAVRRAEWAQTLHRHADFDQALIFSESALKDLYQTPTSTLLYWIAGRSAHMVGQYQRAQTHFGKLIEFHSGTEEAAEALLRSGLIHLRLKSYGQAQGQFEKLIAQKKDRFDLQARYWLVRSLQAKGDKDKAALEAKVVIDKYPYTYYGLRLSAEANGNEYAWMPVAATGAATAPVPDGRDLFLYGSQKDAWLRFKALTKAGWLLEAQSEVQSLPVTKNPWLEFTYAKFMAKCFQFPTAIRFMSEAMDTEPSLRSAAGLAVVYPKSFSYWVEAESKKYNLNPILVRSLIRQESAFGIRAMSTSNAQGLMQLIPGTAQDMARKLGMKRLEIPEDVFRPEVNIPLGTTYISMMLDQFSGSVPFALGAYNAGPTKMKAFIEARDEIKDQLSKPSSAPMDEIWFDELPWAETSFYIKAILRNSLLYKLLDVSKVDWTQLLWQDLHNKKPNIK